MELKELDLNTVAGGAGKELFQHALAQVLDNIRDVNTGLEKRAITLKFEFAPKERSGDKVRSEMEVTCRSSVKLAGVLPHSSHAFIERDGQGFRALTNDVRQEEINLGTGEVIGRIGGTGT